MVTGAGHAVEHAGRFVQPDADAVHFVFDPKPPVTNPAAHQHRGVIRKAPVRAVIRTIPCRQRLEFVHRPAPGKYLRIAAGVVFAQPNVGVAVWVDLAASFCFVNQRVGHERVGVVIDVHDASVGRWIFDQQLFNRIVGLVGIPRKPDFRTLFADRRQQ